jgi:soluble lytic murein transglycosylase-like protein
MEISSVSTIDPSALTTSTSDLWPDETAGAADTQPSMPASSDALPGAHPSGDDQAAGAKSGIGSTIESLFGAVERGFSALTGALQNEFGALEQRVSGLLGALFTGPATKPDASAAVAGNAAATSSPQALAPSPYDGLIRRAAAKNQLDPALLTAVVRQESGFRADARSTAGALGLMQLMPSTAQQLGVADPLDPEQNVDGGARLLRSLIDQFGGRLDLALAAYNAGPSAVQHYGGVPPYIETQAYVRDILTAYRGAALGPAS